MRNFKLILRTVAVFLLAIVLLSAFFIGCYLSGENFYFQDGREREAASGKLTFLICGTSHTMFSVRPDIIDKRMGCRCYNLSGAMLTLQGRYALLEQELARNPGVYAIILEVSPSTLLGERREDETNGDLLMLGRLDSAELRWKYFRENFSVEQWPEVYYDMTSKGMEAALRLLMGTYTKENQILSAGFYENDKPSKPIPTDYEELYHLQSLPEDVSPENAEWLDRIVTLCKENNRSVYLITTPQTRYYNCVNSNLDFFQSWYSEFAEQHGIQYFNFNLYKDKLERLPDESCFYDETHLNGKGGEIFTEIMTRIIRHYRHGQNTAKEFYRSYEEMDKYQNN